MILCSATNTEKGSQELPVIELSQPIFAKLV